MIDNGIFASAISETIKRKILRFFTSPFSTLVVSNRSTIAKFEIALFEIAYNENEEFSRSMSRSN